MPEAENQSLFSPALWIAPVPLYVASVAQRWQYGSKRCLADKGNQKSHLAMVGMYKKKKKRKKKKKKKKKKKRRRRRSEDERNNINQI